MTPTTSLPKRLARAARAYVGLRARRLQKSSSERVQRPYSCPRFLAVRLLDAARRHQRHQLLRAFRARY